MNYISHGIAGVAIAFVVTKIAPVDEVNTIILYSSCIFGSLLPDIDHPKSILGRFIPLWLFCKHRGITHTLLFTVLIGAAGAYFNITLGIGLGLGILSHLLLDATTPMGVRVLYPFR